MYAQVDSCALAHLENLLVDLLLYLCHHFLDASRVYAAVGYKLVQSQAANLASDGVESTDDDGFGGVVDDNLDAGSRLEGSDVAALATDDASLHLVVVDVEHRDGVLDSCLGSDALDALDDDALGFLGCRHACVVHNIVDVCGGVRLGFVLKGFDETLASLFNAEA